MKSEKTPCAVLGSGLIGCDLLVKILKSKYLKCVMFAGQRDDSPGLAFAKDKAPTSTKSIDAILETDAKIVFDATTAESAKRHAKLLKDRLVIDLTPSKVGAMCIPSLNLQGALNTKNINLISCGAQVVIPVIDKIKNLERVEVVTTIASKAAGIGTRNN